MLGVVSRRTNVECSWLLRLSRPRKTLRLHGSQQVARRFRARGRNSVDPPNKRCLAASRDREQQPVAGGLIEIVAIHVGQWLSNIEKSVRLRRENPGGRRRKLDG